MKLLRAIFGLAEGEAGKVFAFALLGGLIQCGLSVGMSSADSLFLVHVGAAKLPVVYLLTPLVMVVYILIYSFYLGRFGIDQTVKLTLMLLGLGGVGLALGIEHFIESGQPERAQLLYYGTKLYTGLWYIALYTLFWNFVDGYFDILDAKRLFSYLSAGAAAGAALGGALVTVLSEHLQVHELFLVWALIAMLTYPVFEVIRRTWPKLEGDDDIDQREAGFLAQAKQTIAGFRASRFAMLIASVLFFTMSVTLICEYQYFETFSKNRSEADLAVLFGKLFFAVNVFNFALTFFAFNRLVAVLGIRNLPFIQPVSYAVTFVCFLIIPGDFSAAVGFFAYHGLLTSIDYNSTNFLLNALPARGKKQLRTFIEGLCEPMANAVTGVFLIFLVQFLSPEQISTVGMTVAIVCLVLVLWMRGAYVSAMVTNLKGAWLDLTRSTKDFSAALAPGELEALRTRILRFTPGVSAVEDHLLAIRLIMPHDRLFALEALFEIIEGRDEAVLDEATRCFAELVSEHGPELMQKVLIWLEQNQDSLPPVVTFELVKLGIVPRRVGVDRSGADDVQSTAAKSVVLHTSDNIGELSEALKALESLLGGDDRARLAAVRAIGCLGNDRYAQLLVEFIGSSSPEVSAAALRSARELATPQTTRLLPSLIGVLDSRDEPRRLLALDCLERIGDSGALSAMLEKSWSFSPQERRKAEGAIVSTGLRAVPVIVSVLTDQGASYRGRSIAARALAKLSFAQLEAFGLGIIALEIERAYACHMNRQLLEPHLSASSGARVLDRFYRDEERTITDFVLELLTLSGRVASFELLSASLRSSAQKERANAIETVQQACPRSVFRAFAPLLDTRRAEQRRRIVRARIQRDRANIDAMLESALGSVHPLESAAAAQALWEIRGSASLELLRERLRRHAASERASVLRELIARIEDGANASQETLVERIDVLLRSEFFQSFSIEELHVITRQSTPVGYASGEMIYRRGAPATELFVVEDGSFEVVDENGARTVGVGAVFGSEAVFGAALRASDVRSLSGRAMRVTAESVLGCAALNSRVGAGLLAQKLGVTHAT